MDINYSIDKIDEDDATQAFLYIHPIPKDSKGTTMSVEEWIKEWGRLQFVNAIMQGKRLMAEAAIIVKSDIIK